MIYLQLLWVFFKIGLFTIGGGYAMLPMITDEVISRGWLDETTLIDFIAVAESTPGPFAINIATFIGMEQAGIAGAVLCTLGVILPSIIIITLIAKFFGTFTEKKLVKTAFSGLRAAVVGLIGCALITIALPTFFGVGKVLDLGSATVDWVALILFVIVVPLGFIKIKKKKLHPIFMILLAAGLGILAYGVILPRI